MKVAHCMRCRWRSFAMALGAALMVSSAYAQYFSDETLGAATPRDHVRYFGSAKDENGKLLADVTILLEGEQASFVFLTNHDGRFRGALPLQIPGTSVKARCVKSGFESLRIIKRPGPKTGAEPSMQVDCVLRKVS